MVDRISSLDSGYRTGDLSIFPEAIDDKNLLYQATNNSKVRLKQTLSYNGKSVIVETTEGFPATGLIRIGEENGTEAYELIAYGKKTSNSFLDLKRGFGGSKQTVWKPGTTYVSNSVVADHHNVLKDAIINIQTDLGTLSDPDPESLNGILKEQEVRYLTPKPLFRAFPIKGPPELTVRFQNFTTGHIVRNLWDFGDGSTSLEKSPTHTYLTEGSYTVKLNVITSTGAMGIATKTEYIVVNADESLPFFYVESISDPYSVETASALTLEGDDTTPKDFVFVDQTDGDIVQRNWIFGDGENYTENDPDRHTISHIFSSPGEYIVSCIIVFANRRLKRVELAEPLIVL